MLFRSLKDLKVRLELKAATTADVAQVEASRAGAELAVIKAENLVTITEANLRMLMHSPDDEAFSLGTELAALTHGHSTGHLPGGVLAVLVMVSAPAGMGLAVVTANVTVPGTFTGNAPTEKRHGVLAGEPLAHDHPALLAPALKVVLAGTVSVMTTPVAGSLEALV